MLKDTLRLEEDLLEKYDSTFDKNGISGKRLAYRLDALSKIGRTKENGSNRPGFSNEEKEAKELVIEWMKKAGLDVKIDGAGNVFGRLEGKNPELPAILSGSHVDTVPNGGHFDGTLGVLSALEVAQSWKDTGYQPEKPYEVVIFSDEEGSRFQESLNGSEAMMGNIDLAVKRKLKDQNNISFERALQNVGLSSESYAAAARNLDEIDTFVEVHIEQGKQLEKENLPCGIVTGIAGPHWIKFIFEGNAGHAGNTPMDDRQDALVAAGEFIASLNKFPRQINDSSVATVGKVEVEPNGINVIPGKVTLYVDIRDIDAEDRNKLSGKILNLGSDLSEKHGVKVSFEHMIITPPVPVPEDRQNKMKEALIQNGISPFYLPSGAGHDAQIIGKELPIAMLFVQSQNGISHNPAEWSKLNDCVQGIHVLKTYIEKLQRS